MTDPTDLYRVAYVSRATQPMSVEELSSLLAKAQENNRRNAISGLLVYDAGAFLQVFEGPTEAVTRLVANIQQDPRHTDVVVLSAGPVTARYFEGWGMDMANLDRFNDSSHETLRAFMRNHHIGDRATIYKALVLFCEAHAQPA
jgi:hypothetical protein